MTENDGLWNLKGASYEFDGWGRSERERREYTRKFYLSQGVLVVYFEHDGGGPFQVSLARAETGSKGDVRGRLQSLGKAMAPPIYSAAGSVKSMFQYLAKGAGASQAFEGFLVNNEWLSGSKLGEAWDGLKSGRGLGGFKLGGRLGGVKAVGESSTLMPGSYKLRVEATGRWRCWLMQPELGQSTVEFPVHYVGMGRDLFAEIYRMGSRPLRAKMRHDGEGELRVSFLSVDGLDKREFMEKGQVDLEDVPIDVKPGKEYLVLVKSSGDWELEFTEGY